MQYKNSSETVITVVVLIVLLWFLNIEKRIGKEKEEITARKAEKVHHRNHFL